LHRLEEERHQDDEDFEDLEPQEHNCMNNHDKSSHAMEAHACLDMVVTMYDKYTCIMDRICVDDDGATRALLKWSNDDYMVNTNTTKRPTIPIGRGKNAGKPKLRPNKGELPPHIPKPTFIADPNHRKKLLTKQLMLLLKCNQCEGKGNIIQQSQFNPDIGKNFAYLIPRMQEDWSV
jgi:hypothetical protein